MVTTIALLAVTVDSTHCSSSSIEDFQCCTSMLAIAGCCHLMYTVRHGLLRCYALENSLGINSDIAQCTIFVQTH
jgi:hypothetical protein